MLGTLYVENMEILKKIVQKNKRIPRKNRIFGQIFTAVATFCSVMLGFGHIQNQTIQAVLITVVTISGVGVVYNGNKKNNETE